MNVVRFFALEYKKDLFLKSERINDMDRTPVLAIGPSLIILSQTEYGNGLKYNVKRSWSRKCCSNNITTKLQLRQLNTENWYALETLLSFCNVWFQ